MQVGDNPLETRISYTYDTKGNTTRITKDNAEKVVYIWSYNFQYPIAEIKGATSSEVSLALGFDVSGIEMVRLGSNFAPDVNGENIGGRLRRSFKDKPILITTYTYKPLIGIESVTDPRGLKTTYEYDSYGRLTAIRDHNGKVVNNYNYNYKQ